MTDSSINKGLQAYTEWRQGLAKSVLAIQKWLNQENLIETQTHQQLDKILNHINDDNLNVAFVAEFSRGKTELINTVFFGQYRERILPSGAGRTTMCPTELFYNPEQAIGIQLLPIQTRAGTTSLQALKQQPKAWTDIPFTTEDPEKLSKLLQHLTDVIKVPRKVAVQMDFPLANDIDEGLAIDKDGMVEIPKWRHAMINLKHPLLEQNLVILDTPGLNAIGTEPELTLNQLSQAHSIVFVLGSDTGVTKSDLELWTEHVALDDNSSRLVALNKIDTLWDQIRSTKEINAEIDKQIVETAKTLNIKSKQVFPISAQKGLLGKIRRDSALLTQSRIGNFETAIAENLIPSKKKIVLTNVFPVTQALIKNIDSLLSKRVIDVDEHKDEISQLYSKNKDVIQHIMQKVEAESDNLENQTQRFIAIKTVFTKHINELISLLSSAELEQQETLAREQLRRSKSNKGIQKAFNDYFRFINKRMHLAALQASEIDTLCKKMHKIFSDQQSISSIFLRKLELDRHIEKLNALENKYLYMKKNRKLVVKGQLTLTFRFFDSVALAGERTINRALNETNDWSRTLLMPLETRVREHKIQLRRRLESVKRINKSSDTLGTRLKELNHSKDKLMKQKTQLYALVHNINRHLLQNSYTEQQNPKTAHKDNVVKIKP
ncbi:MAG: dynamin family protein [Arenicella sp.]